MEKEWTLYESVLGTCQHQVVLIQEEAFEAERRRATTLHLRDGVVAQRYPRTPLFDISYAHPRLNWESYIKGQLKHRDALDVSNSLFGGVYGDHEGERSPLVIIKTLKLEDYEAIGALEPFLASQRTPRGQAITGWAVREDCYRFLFCKTGPLGGYVKEEALSLLLTKLNELNERLFQSNRADVVEALAAADIPSLAYHFIHPKSKGQVAPYRTQGIPLVSVPFPEGNPLSVLTGSERRVVRLLLLGCPFEIIAQKNC